MHKQIYGVFHLKLALSPQSDLLTQGSQEQANLSEGRQSAMQFLHARHPRTGKRTPCISGATLKGVLRSTAEKVLRSFDQGLACDPFEEEPTEPGYACSHRLAFAKEQGCTWRSNQVYGLVCPACRLFGSLAHAGLIEVEDAWATRVTVSQEQVRIAIDRLLGGVAPGAMYRIEPLTSESRFETSLKVTNFELWQLGLLALALRELDEGQALLGWGTRRGLGRVSVSFDGMGLRYPRALYDAAAREHAGPGRAPSAQRLIPANQRENLGYPVEDLWLLENATPRQGDGWRDADWVAFKLADKGEIAAFLGDCVEQALAPRLRLGREAFGYHRERGE
jgi:CRISPR/Cas system CSM-associated protein Csm3 (group 7 of RAMP superfamily)